MHCTAHVRRSAGVGTTILDLSPKLDCILSHWGQKVNKEQGLIKVNFKKEGEIVLLSKKIL